MDKIAAAEKAAGLNLDTAAVRDALIKHTQHDLGEGTLKTEDMGNFPRVGGAFVATGAVSEIELEQALAKQKEVGASGAKPCWKRFAKTTQ